MLNFIHRMINAFVDQTYWIENESCILLLCKIIYHFKLESEFEFVSTSRCINVTFKSALSPTPCLPSAGCGEEGGPSAASSKEDAWEELQELSGAASEGAGALPADPPAAVPSGLHALHTGCLPAFSSLCEHASWCTVETKSFNSDLNQA